MNESDTTSITNLNIFFLVEAYSYFYSAQLQMMGCSLEVYFPCTLVASNRINNRQSKSEYSPSTGKLRRTNKPLPVIVNNWSIQPTGFRD